MTRTLSILASTVALAGAASFAPARVHLPTPAPAADETAVTYKKLLEGVGSALVTVKFVMKMDGGPGGGGDDSGRDVETTGLMIEADGLVLVSNAKMGGLASRMGASVNPTNIRVLTGDDTEGLKAKILARDSDLDLCWISVDDEKAKDKKFAFVDFSSAGAAPAPTIGDKLYVVERMGKFFDHALSVDEGRVGGSAKKPRPLMIPSGFGGSQREMLGAPMFNSDTKVVGVNILQIPDKEDVEGGDSGGEGNFGILLLPASEVVKATIRGKEMAAKSTKDEPKKSDAKPETDAKKDDTKKVEPKKP
jgi:hypothetical protein